MKHSGISRRLLIILALIAGFLLLSIFLFISVVVTSRPLLSRGPALGAPVRWSSLPVPVVVNPQWTSFTYAGPVNDLIRHDGLLWAGTDGGLVVWSLAGGGAPAAKFTAEHGLVANRVTDLAVGRDGAIWAGTVSGLSRYDGRSWQNFTPTEGLPDATIRDVVVDRDGFVWVATTAGLARYDGRAWELFTDQGLLAALPGLNVAALAVDAANRLWVVTDQGLARYDGRWETISAAGVPWATVNDMMVGSAGEVWLSSTTGLFRFDGTAWQTLFPALPDQPPPVDGPVAVALAGDGSVYTSVNPDGFGLVRLDPDTNVSRLVVPSGELPARVAATALLVDDNGGLWFGAGDQVFYANGDDWQSLAAPSELPSPEISDMLVLGESLWVATGAGVTRYNGRWQMFGVADGLAGGPARGLAADSEGRVWAAANSPLDGLSRFDPASDKWETVICPVDAPAGVVIRAAITDTTGAVWLATELGISRYDGGAWRYFTERDGLPTGPVNTLVVSGGDVVWAGNDNGLARFSDDRWQMVDNEPVIFLAVTGDQLWRLGADGLAVMSGDTVENVVALPPDLAIRGITATPDGVWLATARGVWRYDGAQWITYTTDDGLASLDVTAIMAGDDGVWAATSDDNQQNDIVVFDGTGWRPHPNRDPAAEQLLGNVVRDMLTTPDGAVWLATTGGVNRYRDGVWSTYTVESGLPGADVGDLAVAYDTLWAATNLGLARFNGQMWASFGVASHDQPGAGVGALAVAASGELWVALEEGWPNNLRVFNGAGWTVIPLLTSNTIVRQLSAVPDGRMLALADDRGRSYVGIFDDGQWLWLEESQWPLIIDRLAVGLDGNLWVTGREAAAPDSATVISVIELTAQGFGRVLGRFTETDTEAGGALAPMSGNSSNSIFFAADGQVFVGGTGVVYVFDGRQLDDFQPEEVRPLPLDFTRHTFSLTQDANGRLWVGTERGAVILSEDTDELAGRSFYAPVRTPSWWGSVRVMSPRPDGGLLLGTAAGGIGIFTGRDYDGVLHPSQGPPAWARAFYPINAVLTGADNRLWVGSEGGGAAAFSGTRWEILAPAPGLVTPVNGLAISGDTAWVGTGAGLVAVAGLSDPACRYEPVGEGSAITDVLRDTAGELWAATASNGVFHTDGRGQGIRNELGTAPVPAMTVAPNGEMWFANGHQPWLTRLRPPSQLGDEGVWGRLPLDVRQVAQESITSLAIAPNQDVWIGSDEGLIRFSSGVWTRLMTGQGLADNQIQRLQPAPDGALWVVTAGGLSRLQP